MALDSLSTEAHEDEIETKEIIELSINAFREQYGEHPFKSLMQYPKSKIIECWDEPHEKKKFRKMDKGIVRFIPLNNDSVYAAAIFNEKGDVIMQFQYHLVYEFGDYYQRSHPRVSRALERIHEDLEKNPLKSVA